MAINKPSSACVLKASEGAEVLERHKVVMGVGGSGTEGSHFNLAWGFGK